MKALTAFRKIVNQHLLMVFPDGRLVLLLDWLWGHEITSPNAILDMIERGFNFVFDQNKIKMMIDHVSPSGSTNSAIQAMILRKWTREQGIEFLDVGRGGICHAVIPEKGWILPGQIGIIGDSHGCTEGAFGAFTAGVGTTELECGMVNGFWVCPPQKVIRANFVGNMPANVFAKDLILSLINKISVKGATNCVIEFGGPVIDEMSMEGRMTMTNMAVEAGATSGMMSVDMTTVRYLLPALRRIYGDKMPAGEILADLCRWNSDPEAKYDKLLNIDVTDMTPASTIGYSPGEVVPVTTLTGRNVDQVVIGSCTNARLEDLAISASMFRQYGKKVAENIRCVVIPATKHIYEQALKEGYIQTFMDAGCSVNAPTCGPCLGMSCGVIAPGEVCVSTTNRNFDGRMGKGGMVHLVSPATAVATAVAGCIMEPEIKMCECALDDVRSLRERGYIAQSLTDWMEKPADRPDYAELARPLSAGVSKDFSGKAFYLPVKNVNTDQIIPAVYLDETDKAKMGKHCLENVVTSPADREMMRLSQILVADENFGCGSSREHAPWALQGLGIDCVIAPSFARIFENNMFAIGNLCIILPQKQINLLLQKKPKDILVNWKEGWIEWRDGQTGHQVNFELSEYQKDLIRYGGLVGVTIRLAAELQAAGKL